MRYALAAALFLSPALFAQEIDIPFQKFVLPNGLTLIVHEDHKAPIVAVNVWYHVGSKNERPGKTGFAHLFEHLMFRGTAEYPPEKYTATLQTAGAAGQSVAVHPLYAHFVRRERKHHRVQAFELGVEPGPLEQK